MNRPEPCVGSDRPLDVIVGGLSYYYHRDVLGSTTTVTNASGTVAASYQYDAYGRPRQTDDTIGNPIRFAGLPTDASTGLVEDRARLYDPATGDFLTPDPLGGGYAYAGDDPVNNVDPTGTMYARPPLGGLVGPADPATSRCTHYCGHQGSWSGTTGGGSSGGGATGGGGSTSSGASGGLGTVIGGMSLSCWAGWTMWGTQLFVSIIGLQIEGQTLENIAYYALTDFQWSAVMTGTGLQGAVEFLLSIFWWLFANYVLPHLADLVPWWMIPAFVAENMPEGWGLKLIEIGVSAFMGLAFLGANGCW